MANSLAIVGTNQPELVIPALINGLDDSDRKVVHAANGGLASFGAKAKAAVPKLIEHLGRQGMSGFSALALAGIVGTNQAVAPIINALTNQDDRVKGSLISVLGTFQTQAQEAVPSLVAFANDENPLLRATVIRALIEIGAESKVLFPILIKELSDGDTINRYDLLRALAKMGSEAKAAVPILVEQIRILTKEQFPAPALSAEESQLFEQRYASSRFHYDFSPLDSEEFKTLRKIDPGAAAEIKKQIAEEKSKASKTGSSR